jgi:hypothetical protein
MQSRQVIYDSIYGPMPLRVRARGANRAKELLDAKAGAGNGVGYMRAPTFYPKAHDKLIGVEPIRKTRRNIGSNPYFREGVYIGNRALIASAVGVSTNKDRANAVAHEGL